jgi:DNA polymerase III epsilon subunit-like protein
MIETAMFFIDCEASSLSDRSFPIEVAWVDEMGQGDSRLILPEPDWRDWSATAEAMHGISYAMLREQGISAPIVAQHVLDVLKDHTLVSDNPGWDQQWIGRLLAIIGHDPLPVIHMNHVMAQEIQRLAQSNSAVYDTPEYHRQSRLLLDQGQNIVGAAMYNALLQARTRHRAFVDAQILYRSWRRAKDEIDSLLT